MLALTDKLTNTPPMCMQGHTRVRLTCIVLQTRSFKVTSRSELSAGGWLVLWIIYLFVYMLRLTLQHTTSLPVNTHLSDLQDGMLTSVFVHSMCLKLTVIVQSVGPLHFKRAKSFRKVSQSQK